MATILHKETMSIQASQHGPDFDPEVFLIDPDLSAVSGVDQRYWKIVNDQVLEMSQEEKAAIDLSYGRPAKISELYRQYQATLSAGYDTGLGYTIAATEPDQARLSQDAVLQSQKLLLNLVSGGDTVNFIDAAGVPRLATIAQYIRILIDYGDWCRAKLISLSVARIATASATSTEELDAIQLQ